MLFYSSTAFTSDCDYIKSPLDKYLCEEEQARLRGEKWPKPSEPSVLEKAQMQWEETQMPWETNYWECILDEMPGAKTKTVTFAVRKKCNQYSRDYKIEKKSSFFGIKNASDCVIEYASDTPSETAAKAIRAACNKLYVR